MTTPIKTMNYRDLMAIIHPDQDFDAKGKLILDTNTKMFRDALKKRGYPEEISVIPLELGINEKEMEVLAAHFVKGILHPGIVVDEIARDVNVIIDYYLNVWGLFKKFKVDNVEYISVRFLSLVAMINKLIEGFVLAAFVVNIELNTAVLEGISKSPFFYKKKVEEEKYDIHENIVSAIKDMIMNPVQILKKYLNDKNIEEAISAIRKTNLKNTIDADPDESKSQNMIKEFRKKEENPDIIGARITLRHLVFILQTLKKTPALVTREFVIRILSSDIESTGYARFFKQ